MLSEKEILMGVVKHVENAFIGGFQENICEFRVRNTNEKF